MASTASSISSSRPLPVDKMNLSFAGCGFNGIYHVGVASCFREYCPQVACNKISGASVGAIAAAAMACQISLGECLSRSPCRLLFVCLAGVICGNFAHTIIQFVISLIVSIVLKYPLRLKWQSTLVSFNVQSVAGILPLSGKRAFV